MTELLERILGRPLMLPDGDGGEAPAPVAETPAETDEVRDDDAPVSDDEPDDAPDAEPGEGDEVDGAERQAAEPVDDGSEEIDFNGKKVKIPREIKPALMFQADYTRKTQELAEQRRALEAEAAQQAGTAHERIVKAGQLAHADDMLSRYQRIDWNTLRNENPETAQARLIEWNQWKDARDTISRDVASLDAKAAEARDKRALEAQQATVTRMQEAQMTLHRDIPNWATNGPKVAEFAIRDLGYTEQELRAMTDPRFGKILHKAWLGAQLAQKQQAAAKLKTQVKTTAVETPPLVTVAARGGGPSARKSLNDLAKGDDTTSMKAFAETWKKTYPARRG